MAASARYVWNGCVLTVPARLTRSLMPSTCEINSCSSAFAMIGDAGFPLSGCEISTSSPPCSKIKPSSVGKMIDLPALAIALALMHTRSPRGTTDEMTVPPCPSCIDHMPEVVKTTIGYWPNCPSDTGIAMVSNAITWLSPTGYEFSSGK